MQYAGPVSDTHMKALGRHVPNAIDHDRNWWGYVVVIVGEHRII